MSPIVWSCCRGALAAGLVAMAASHGQAGAQGPVAQPSEDGGAPGAPGAAAASAAEKIKGGVAVKVAVLKVVVRAEGQPVASADVQLSSLVDNNEVRRFTNAAGEAVFNAAPAGQAKVRVIATGFVSARKDLTLRKGSQNLEVSLTPQP